MSASLYARAKSLAKQMNVSLGRMHVGGGSDGNFTAALGIPTLDAWVPSAMALIPRTNTFLSTPCPPAPHS